MRLLAWYSRRRVSKLWLVRAYSSSAPPALRPYQLESIEAIHSALNRRQRPAVSLPTGSGKTRIFTHLLRNVRPMYAEDTKRTKVLVIVNRKELLDQAAATIGLAHPDLRINLLNSQSDYDANADVVVSTYQSLASNHAWRLYQMNPADFKLIIIDEAHHSVASSYFTVLEHFKAVGHVIKPEPVESLPVYLEDASSGDRLTSQNDTVAGIRVNRRNDHPERRVHIVGFSATFWRGDHEFLSDVYDEVCYHESVDRMIKDGYLCTARLQQISLPAESSSTPGQRVSARDFFLGSLTESSAFLYDIWAANDEKYHHTVIFAINTTQVSAIVDCFRQNGIDARYIVGHMTKRERESTISAFKSGEFPVLVNCQILTEGTDIPLIDQIIIARGLGSKGLTMQIVGRGLRLHPNKQHCNIVVFPDFQKDFQGGFLPQLESVLQPTSQGEREETESKPLKAPKPFIDYRKMMSTDAEFDVNLLSFDDYVPEDPRNSIMQWIAYNKAYYLFPQHSRQYYVIDKRVADSQDEETLNGKLWCFATINRIDKKFTQRIDRFKSNNLSDTTRYADQNLKIQLPSNVYKALLSNARWQYAPPTEKQLKLLKTKNSGLDYRRLNRGTATHIISLLSIGCKLSQTMVDSLVAALPPPPHQVTPDFDVLSSRLQEIGI